MAQPPHPSTPLTPGDRIAALEAMVETLHDETEGLRRAADDERRRADRLRMELNLILGSRLWRTAESLRSLRPRRRKRTS